MVCPDFFETDVTYILIKILLDFLLLEYRIASFNATLFIKGSNSVLSEGEIWEMFYVLTIRNPPKYFYQFSFHFCFIVAFI